MRKRCGERLPSFTAEEKELITGTSEFFGLHLGKDQVPFGPCDRASCFFLAWTFFHFWTEESLFDLILFGSRGDEGSTDPFVFSLLSLAFCLWPSVMTLRLEFGTGAIGGPAVF